MFEAAGILIVNSESPVERKQVLMRSLLTPLMDAFRLLLTKLPQETEEERQTALADCLSHAVGFARSESINDLFIYYSVHRHGVLLTSPPSVAFQPDQQSFQQQADSEAVWLHRGVPGLPAGLPARTQLPRATERAAQLRPLVPAPHDHLHGGGGAALRPRCLRAHAEGLRGQRSTGVHPAHQPDHCQV